jgi:5-formyltetrahydrofolate cyclo-ligase
MGVSESKADLRKAMRFVMTELTPIQRRELSRKAADLLKSQQTWRKAESILFFAPLPDELDIWLVLDAAIADGKRIALPRYHSGAAKYAACHVPKPAEKLRIGQFGIREPDESCESIELNPLDLVLVPGVAFDLHGRRLGRGKGFYDRLLAEVRGVRCGVAFDQQIVREIPVDPHDVCVNCILTPTRWLEFVSPSAALE